MIGQTFFQGISSSRFLIASGSQKESMAVFLMNFLRTFAVGLVGIFGPVYIFQYPGKPLILESLMLTDIVWVGIYYLIYFFSMLVGVLLFSGAIFRSLGFKKSILLSFLFLILAISILIVFKDFFPALLLAPVFFGLAVNFYWIPFHIFFVRKTHQGGNFGEESSWNLFLNSLAEMSAPFISGLIISQSGFQSAFWASAAVLGLALLPLFLLVSEKPHREHKLKEIFFASLKDPEQRQSLLGMSGSAVEGEILAIFWPILIFQILGSFFEMGVVVSLAIFLSSLTIILAGKVFERSVENPIFKWSIWFNTFLFLPRLFVGSPSGLYSIQALHYLNRGFYLTGITSRSYDLARKFGDSDFILIREVFLHLARFLALLLAVFLMIILQNWRIVFVVAGLSSFLGLLVFKSKKD